MPPHASHLLQPLDLSIFGPLKTYLAREVDRFTRTGISRLQKQEWVRAYCRARPKAIQAKNIASGFKHGGLLPYSPGTVLRHIPPELEVQTTVSKGLGTQTHFTFAMPTNLTQLHQTNQVLKRTLSSRHKKELESPVKRYIFDLADVCERMQAQLVITEKDSQEKAKVLKGRKRQCSGKRAVIKDKVLVTTQELLDGIKEAEAVTEAKKTAKKKKKTSVKVQQTQRTIIDGLDSEQEFEDVETSP